MLSDRVRETTTTTGTGTVTLAGAVSGFRTFATAFPGTTSKVTYVIDDGAGNWEVGSGTYTLSGTTLSRTTVWASSNSGSLVSFAAGTKNVFVTVPASAGLSPLDLSVAAIGDQTINASTTALVVGTLIPVPPGGFQIGTTIKWTILLGKTAAGVASRSHVVRCGTAGTTSDAAIATMALTPTAVVDEGEIIIYLTVRSLGASAAGKAKLIKSAIGITGLGTVNGVVATMATWNSTTANQFLSVSIATGASEVLTITQAWYEILNQANPP